ncbi:Panacea domain-containing protein [Methyloglobulus morosus]|nr:Panacea domain-containing protein [Methyloglobulus morosus]
MMPIHVKHFDREKALETILYIARGLANKATLHSISKILYLSDKLHLQEYGRLICGDKYIAMDYGPVPSAIYDMMKVADNRDHTSIDVDWDEIILESIEVKQGRNIVPKRDCNMDVLSESEVECLNLTILEYGQKSFGQLTDITHDDAWKSTNGNETISIDNIIATLKNAAEVLSYIHAI